MSQFDMYAFDQEHQQQQQPRKKSKLPFLLLVSRVATLASLLVSIGIMKTTDKTYDEGRIYYDDYHSYGYTFWVMVIGCVYNLLQIPLAVYYLFRRKLLINYSGYLKYEFYADKVIMLLLGTAVGATFGATTDLDKHVRDETDWEKHLHNYWGLMYLPASFLLVAFVTSAVSTIVSSETALAKSKE